MVHKITSIVSAKRAGDYYMFEYDPRIEEDTTHPKEQYVPEVTPGAGEYDKLDPAQVQSTLILVVYLLTFSDRPHGSNERYEPERDVGFS